MANFQTNMHPFSAPFNAPMPTEFSNLSRPRPPSMLRPDYMQSSFGPDFGNAPNRKRPLPLADFQPSFNDFGPNSWAKPVPNEWPPNSRAKPMSNEWSNSGVKPMSNEWSSNSGAKPMSHEWRSNSDSTDDWSGYNSKPKYSRPSINRTSILEPESWNEEGTKPGPWFEHPKKKPWSSQGQPSTFHQNKHSTPNPQPWSKPKYTPKPPKKTSTVDLSSVLTTTYFLNQQKVNMPKELISKFGPLRCDLCGVLSNSTVTAKTHYSGKLHDKKVAQYMQKYFTDKGEPIPDQFKEGSSRKPASSDNTTDKTTLFCDVCNVGLTSRQHAEQHYMGKAHNKAIRNGGKLKPTPLPEEKPDPTGRFNVGKQFVEAVDPVGLTQPDTNDQPQTTSSKDPFLCELCCIYTTSADQLQAHIGGSKHLKKLKMSAGNSPVVETVAVPPPVPQDVSLLASLTKPQRKCPPSDTTVSDKDYSIYRTPSGRFYCAKCDVTMNSESQFSQHNDSKKHKLNLAKGKSLISDVKVELKKELV